MLIVFIMYSLVYFDCVNYGFVVVVGINYDLGISQGLLLLIGVLFFFGYFFFQILGVIYVECCSVKKFVFISLVLWGLCVVFMGVVSDIFLLLVIWFVLGVVEVVVMFVMFIYISNWFIKYDCLCVNMFLIFGNFVMVFWMLVVLGYFVCEFGWCYMFIVEGVFVIIWVVCWWCLVQDKLVQVLWLSIQEKCDLEQVLVVEQVVIKLMCNYGEVFCLLVVIKLCVQYFCWSIGVYGFVLWLLFIVKNGLLFGMVEMGWLLVLLYFVVIIVMFVVLWVLDKIGLWCGFVWLFLLVGVVVFVVLFVFGLMYFWLLYVLFVIVGVVMYGLYGLFFVIVLELLLKNVVGGVMVLINSMGVFGLFVGLYFVGYLNGVIGLLLVLYVFMSIVFFVVVIFMFCVKL